MFKGILIPEAFLGCKIVCDQCGQVYSELVHFGCPACEYVPIFGNPDVDDDFDPLEDALF